MDVQEAARLIAPAVVPGTVWAELGAGTGTFSAALSGLLGRQGKVYAVERAERAARVLDALAHEPNRDERAAITVVRADFMRHLQLPQLDGILLANALHFVADEDQAPLLTRIPRLLSPDGVLLVVEYDNRPRSRWVPYPVSLARLGFIAETAAIGPIEEVGRIGSAFGGTMYAARVAWR
jgi:SAM-dependent methyltransferase